MLGQDDDRGRTDKAAVFFQRAEIERNIVHRCRQDATGRAARQIRVEGMSLGHAATELVDQFAHRDAGRRQLHAGILYPPRHRIAAQAVAVVTAVALPPVCAFFDDVAHPPQRLDIVDQRRQSEQPDLERVRRLVPRQSAFAFDAFQQRRFLAADIGAGAAPHMQHRTARRQLCNFALENFARGRIFVADVDVDLRRFHHMRADQHALDEAMWIGFEIIAILERSRLALVAVDRHQSRAGLAKHRAPLSPRRKTRTTEAAQAGVVERLQEVFFRQFAGAQAVEQRIAAASDIRVVTDIVRQMGVGFTARGRGEHACDTGMIDKVMTDLGGGRGIAAADARRPHDADARAGAVLQLMQQFFRAQHRARQGVADANGQRRDVGLTFLHHVKMRVEGGGLEHFRKGQLHLVRERREVGCGNLMIGVLDQVQMFDQEIAPPRPVTQQKRNLFSGLGLDLAALGGRFRSPAPLAGVFERADLVHIMAH